MSSIKIISRNHGLLKDITLVKFITGKSIKLTFLNITPTNLNLSLKV